MRVLLAPLALIGMPLIAAAPDPLVREERRVAIAGSVETWRLVWKGAPSESRSCGPEDPDMAMTCPCDGFGYAQVGDLALERVREGASMERLPLTPLFTGPDLPSDAKGSGAMLPRWPTHLDDIEHEPTAATIRTRPAVPIRRFKDYDHDGIAGEFLLQIDTEPCGKHVLVAVGVSRDDPHLHALSSAEHPERPLRLYQWQWEALARAADPGRVPDWPCGDHGADQGSFMLLRADHGRLHATRLTTTCPDTMDTKGVLHHDTRFHAKVLKREVL